MNELLASRPLLTQSVFVLQPLRFDDIASLVAGRGVKVAKLELMRLLDEQVSPSKHRLVGPWFKLSLFVPLCVSVHYILRARSYWG